MVSALVEIIGDNSIFSLHFVIAQSFLTKLLVVNVFFFFNETCKSVNFWGVGNCWIFATFFELLRSIYWIDHTCILTFTYRYSSQVNSTWNGLGMNLY